MVGSLSQVGPTWRCKRVCFG
ncbi:hypothetical protein LINGRAHAP2_LOCUS2262 [Linum grandiflorum]